VTDKAAVKELDFEKLDDAARALAGELASAITQAVKTRGQALIAVSGGSTPRLVVEHRREMSLDWERVTITLTDERWVPPGHEDSNETLVRSRLLMGAVESSTFVPLYGGQATPELGKKACESRLRALPLPFDAVYLGLGTDGHFASLFPGGQTQDGKTLCLPIPCAGSRSARMSLSLPALLDARQLMLLYSGSDKHATYLQARKATDAAKIPLSHIFMQNKVPVTVFRAP